MRIAIVADVHSNLDALETVFRHAEKQKALEQVWCLGDTVGYGPEPNACLALLRSHNALTVPGNHDLAAIGLLSTEDFNPDAAAAAAWTALQITPDERTYFESLPHVIRQGEFTLVHGSLRWPIWEYLYTVEVALAHLGLQETPYSLVGHTHVPLLVKEDQGSPDGCLMNYLEDGTALELRDRRLVINPGSVGQPRDGDPRTSYAIYDDEARTVTVHRLAYDIAATQQKMAAADLPAWLIRRLSRGR
jgi:diadenosine tetraphosphatase ApaH/serine/threonine PP2A family protein phosphatase